MRSDPRPCLSARRSSDTEAVDRKVRCHKWGNKFVDNFRGQGEKRVPPPSLRSGSE
jgi:hypothetical protein